MAGKKNKKMDIQDKRKIKLNELGVLWKSYPAEDTASIQAAWMEICRLAFDIYYVHLKEEYEIEAFYKMLQETEEKFDGDKGSLSAFMSNRLELRQIDEWRKERRKTPDVKMVSLDAPAYASMDPEDKTEIGDVVGTMENSSQNAYEDKVVEDAMYELAAQIIHFMENHNKKNGNPVRLNYYKLFYTSGTTNLIKTFNHVPKLQHERDVLQAMKEPFLDFYMDGICRTVKAIYEENMKCYGEILPPEERQITDDKKMKTPIPIPIPDKVGQYYLAQVENNPVSPGAYSGQKKMYTEEMMSILKGCGLISDDIG